jgi:hypothetical protein
MIGHLKKGDWIVEDADIVKARSMVTRLHYSKGVPNCAVAVHGLYRKLDYRLMGIAWWLPPSSKAAARPWWPNPKEVLALSRLVLEPEVPKNGATFLLSRSVKLLDSQWRCLITYADEWRGHTGHIYRVSGWEHTGMTKPQPIYVVQGRMTSRKSGPNTRTHAEMIALGAEVAGVYSKHRFRLVRPICRRSKATEEQVQLL